MSFDPATFEAEVALRLIPTEQLPRVAQNPLEEGLDGPHVLRMAILEPDAGWAIDQALAPMLVELGYWAAKFYRRKRRLYAWLTHPPDAFEKPAKTSYLYSLLSSTHVGRRASYRTH